MCFYSSYFEGTDDFRALSFSWTTIPRVTRCVLSQTEQRVGLSHVELLVGHGRIVNGVVVSLFRKAEAVLSSNHSSD